MRRSADVLFAPRCFRFLPLRCWRRRRLQTPTRLQPFPQSWRRPSPHQPADRSRPYPPGVTATCCSSTHKFADDVSQGRRPGFRLLVRGRRCHSQQRQARDPRPSCHCRKRQLGPEKVPAHLDRARRPARPFRRYRLHLGPLRRQRHRQQPVSRFTTSGRYITFWKKVQNRRAKETAMEGSTRRQRASTRPRRGRLLRAAASRKPGLPVNLTNPARAIAVAAGLCAWVAGTAQQPRRRALSV